MIGYSKQLLSCFSADQACAGAARPARSSGTRGPASGMRALGQAGEQDGAVAEPGPRQLHHQQRLHRLQLRRHLSGKIMMSAVLYRVQRAKS